MKINNNLIIGGLIIAGGLGVFLFLKKRKQKKSYEIIGSLESPTKTSKATSFNPKPYAKNLFKAMDGWGTDEDMIWKAMGGLSADQREAVETYFNENYGDGKSLQKWFENELSGNDLQRALSFIT